MGILSSFNDAVTKTFNVVAVTGNSASQLVSAIGQGAAVAEASAINWRISEELRLDAELLVIEEELKAFNKEDMIRVRTLRDSYRI